MQVGRRVIQGGAIGLRIQDPRPFSPHSGRTHRLAHLPLCSSHPEENRSREDDVVTLLPLFTPTPTPLSLDLWCFSHTPSSPRVSMPRLRNLRIVIVFAGVLSSSFEWVGCLTASSPQGSFLEVFCGVG